MGEIKKASVTHRRGPDRDRTRRTKTNPTDRRKNAMKLGACAALFLASTIAAVACDVPVCPPPNFDSIEPFNLTAWTEHDWFIQEQMPVAYQPSPFFCVRASYRLTEGPDGSEQVDVYNSQRFGYGGLDGPLTDSNSSNSSMPPLKAVIPNASEPSKLAVGPAFVPPSAYGPYWVVFAGPDEDNYEYGIVSGGPPTVPGIDGCISGTPKQINGAGLWLFTKDPTPESDTVLMLRDKAKALGFDLSVLEPATQEGCTYPDVPGDGE